MEICQSTYQPELEIFPRQVIICRWWY